MSANPFSWIQREYEDDLRNWRDPSIAKGNRVFNILATALVIWIVGVLVALVTIAACA